MSAQVLWFPKDKSRAAEVQRGYCAKIFQFPGSCPSHWSSFNHYIHQQLIRDGWSAKDATAKIEVEIQDEIDASSLPSVQERMLFLAGRALFRSEPLNR